MTSNGKKTTRTARTPEGRINQLISLAFDLAEKQLRDGTASSQVITQFLKLADPKETIERDILKENKKLIQAKTKNLESAANMEKLYAEAIAAMKSYRSDSDNEDNDEGDEDDDY